MKRSLMAAIALSVLVAPAAYAQPQPRHPQEFKGDRQVQKPQARRWSKGQRLDRQHRRNVVDRRNYGRYRLKEPPRGYQWVHVDNDFLLIGVATGIISSIIGAH